MVGTNRPQDMNFTGIEMYGLGQFGQLTEWPKVSSQNDNDEDFSSQKLTSCESMKTFLNNCLTELHSNDFTDAEIQWTGLQDDTVNDETMITAKLNDDDLYFNDPQESEVMNSNPDDYLNKSSLMLSPVSNPRSTPHHRNSCDFGDERVKNMIATDSDICEPDAILEELFGAIDPSIQALDPDELLRCYDEFVQGVASVQEASVDAGFSASQEAIDLEPILLEDDILTEEMTVVLDTDVIIVSEEEIGTMSEAQVVPTYIEKELILPTCIEGIDEENEVVQEKKSNAMKKRSKGKRKRIIYDDSDDDLLSKKKRKQNKTAAQRYREKKKQEEAKEETILEEIAAKNAILHKELEPLLLERNILINMFKSLDKTKFNVILPQYLQ